MLKVGVIGFGYWGPNIVRNFNATQQALVTQVCDIDSNLLTKASLTYPNIKTSTNFMDLVQSPDLDVIAIITPVYTHYELAYQALSHGKNIIVEKPFTSTVDQAERLIELADKNNLKIMIDHTYIFTGAVRKIKELISGRILGDLYYYDSTRVNLGLFQHDVNVIWDLAPHDFSIMDYVLDAKPVAISAHGKSHFSNNLEDVAYITFYFEDNLIAHFNLNWLSPVKVRTTLIGGQNKMLVWNDLESDEKIKIYDKGVKVESREGIYNLLVEYRSGDMFSPKIDQKEALRTEIEYFIDCINNNTPPFNDGLSGLRIVKMLEATDKSIKNNGEIIKLKLD